MAKDLASDDTIEVKCPDCKAVIRVAREKAERDMKAKCPNGHDVPLVKML